ncbi:MAG: hypothetical protein AAB426_08865 [Myxococcota bacterium]
MVTPIAARAGAVPDAARREEGLLKIALASKQAKPRAVSPPTAWSKLYVPAAAPSSTVRMARELATLAATTELDDAPELNPGEIHRRTRLVLEHFGVTPEPPSQPLVADLHGRQSAAGLNARLPFFDPDGEFWRYATLVPAESTTAAKLRVYKDRDSKQDLDFEVQLSDGPKPAETLRARLLAAKTNSNAKPLTGLRIALDAGHMGGKMWPPRTGKFIRDGKTTLNEGDLNLQTSSLLAKRLRALGAEVLETRTSHDLVTPKQLEELDLVALGRADLRNRTTDRWFQGIVRRAENDAQLIAAFEESPQMKALFDESQRDNYLMGAVDLDARGKRLLAFRPDIALVLHYDVRIRSNTDHRINPTAPNATKSYVAGGFLEGELARSEDRIQIVRHLVDSGPWDASVQLSRSITGGLSAGLGLERETVHTSVATLVEPAVFARNLHLTRALSEVAFAYVEALYYNRTSEFRALTSTRGSQVIDGVRYAKRAVQVVDALEAGVVNFVKQYRDEPPPTPATPVADDNS